MSIESYLKSQVIRYITSGIKCLVLDEETTGIISLIYSQSQILKKDVYLIERIEALNKQKLLHMKVIFLVRPTQENQNILMNELRDHRFSEYYLYFTNSISNFSIEKIAEADEKDLVKSLQEMFMDYYCIQQDLFTLNIPSTLQLCRVSQTWQQKEASLLLRITEGLSSVLFSLRKIPMIRYQASSELCQNLAQQVTHRMREEMEQSSSQFALSNCLLLIVDRREDPVTPLLNQWTYQAMVHELIGIQNNRVDINQGQKALDKKSAGSDSEFVISPSQDQFFADNEYANFGELASNIKEFIDRVTKEKKQTVQINSLEDMQKAVDKIPEIRQLSGNLSKHVSLSCEISRLVEERQLLKVSKVEQDIACNENKSDQQRAVLELLSDRQIQNYEKLKLVILYALRYETCDKIARMKELLRDCGLKQNSLNLINYVIDYAGKNKRSGDLFLDRNLLSKAQSKLKSVFKDVPNIYTQHQPYIISLLEQLQNGRLKDAEFPSSGLHQFRDKPQEIIIFVAGGTTYEEVKEVGLLNKQPNYPPILLGGTYIHNSRTFLAEVSQMGSET